MSDPVIRPTSGEEPQPIVIHPEPHGAERRSFRDRRANALPVPTVLVERPPVPSEPASVPAEAAVPVQRRAVSLDALRGLFLISMTLGFTIASTGLPEWMYHRQFPPPGDRMVDVAGISWRDLAYGAFLFTMAAALPLTLSRRIQKGDTEIAIFWGALKRYGMLLLFGLLVAHANTFFTGYTQTARAIAIAGFGVMALVYTRPRPEWNQDRWRLIRRAGLVLAIAFLALSPLAYGQTFSFERIDGIIVGLAFASISGSILWYLTRDQFGIRVAVLGVAVALYLGARGGGWIGEWWWSSPAPWAFSPSRLALLTIVVPGLMAGDVLLRWMRAPDEPERQPAWSRGRVLLLAGLTAAITPVIVVGLYNRQVLLTTQLAIAAIAMGLFVVRTPATPTERMLRALFVWGALWLATGLFLEPAEGGIRKTPETLSYFFTSAGTTTMLLVSLTALTEVLDVRRGMRVLTDVGTNPLLAYVLFTVLLNSALELIPAARPLLRGSPAETLLRSALEVAIVVLIVRAASRRRIYWRT